MIKLLLILFITTLLYSNFDDDLKRLYKHLYSDLDKAYTLSDSLFKHETNMINKIKIMKAQGLVLYYQGDLEHGFDIINNAIDKTIDIENNPDVVSLKGELLNVKGILYEESGDYTNAINSYNKSAIIADEIGDSLGVAIAYSNIGDILINREEYEEAMELLSKSYRIFDSFRDSTRIASCLHSLGNCFYSINEPEKSYEYFLKAETIYQNKGDNDGLISLYSSIISILDKVDRSAEIANYIMKSIALSKKMKSITNLKYSYFFASNYYIQKLEPDSSLKYLYKFNEINKEEIPMDMRLNFAKALFLKNNLSESYNELKILTSNIGIKQYPSIYSRALLLRSRIEAINGDLVSSEKSERLSLSILDSLKNEFLSKKIYDLEKRYILLQDERAMGDSIRENHLFRSFKVMSKDHKFYIISITLLTIISFLVTLAIYKNRKI
ncbi:MAG: tetratricopeptide repeat protein [Candidatus Delongbacteria bacterium]|nr:tetratricopeptide repeat protein [Candidatus Delongbacteria bacterium]MBN2836026.1 tetratricopeptide repeat protein [Candidatus Delongbacteria bacterium]